MDGYTYVDLKLPQDQENRTNCVGYLQIELVSFFHPFYPDGKGSQRAPDPHLLVEAQHF